MTRTCRCGQPVTSALYLHYRYPRDRFEPGAVDPWYVHGGKPVQTCGSAGCEAEGYAELLADHPDADVSVDTEPGVRFPTDGAA